MLAIVSVGIANLLIMQRVVILWEHRPVRPSFHLRLNPYFHGADTHIRTRFVVCVHLDHLENYGSGLLD